MAATGFLLRTAPSTNFTELRSSSLRCGARAPNPLLRQPSRAQGSREAQRRRLQRCRAAQSNQPQQGQQQGADFLEALFPGAAAAAAAAVAEGGSSPGLDPPPAAADVGPVDRKAVLHEALKQLTEEGLESAASKYDLHEELFAELDFARINAFSPSAFGGNPAAVVYLPYMPNETWLQRVAAEFDLSETAYLVRRRAPPAGPLQLNEQQTGLKRVGAGSTRPIRGNEFDLRWFTPAMEVKLCGHATLASAHLLFTAGLLEPNCDTVIFHTLSGPLTARRVQEEDSPLCREAQQQVAGGEDSDGGEAGGEAGPGSAGAVKGERRQKKAKGEATGGRPSGRGIVELSLPLLPVVPLEASEWEGIETALGLEPGTIVWAGRNSLHYILAEVRLEEDVLAAEPDMDAVALLPVVGVILTALNRHRVATDVSPGLDKGRPRRKELERADFVARFFAPQAGVDEDPVTGSAFCSLGPYWGQKLGRTQLLGFQASERGGEVAVTVHTGEQRVALQGWAVMVQAGVLMNTMGPGSR